MKDAIAHIKKVEGLWHEPQDLFQHLLGVAALAENYAGVFGNGDWGRLSGLWHDLGKYKPAFQKYLRGLGDCELFDQQDNGETDKQHAIVGALHAVSRFGEFDMSSTRILSYLIAGHHTGLPDWNSVLGTGGALDPKLRETEHLRDAILGIPPVDILNQPMPESQFAGDLKWVHLWVRMLFSCLVDADFLDTGFNHCQM